MGTSFDFDLEDTSPEELESGGKIQPGWYRAVVESVDEDLKARTQCTVFQFKILAGAETSGFNSRKHFERLYESDSDDPQKQKFARQHQMLFAKRLGLIREDHWGAKRANGDFVDSIGTEVFLLFTLQKVKQDGQPTGEMRCQMAYDGLYPANETDPKHLGIIDPRLLSAEQAAILAASKSAAGKRGKGRASEAAAGAVASTRPSNGSGGTAAPMGVPAPAAHPAELPKDSFADF